MVGLVQKRNKIMVDIYKEKYGQRIAKTESRPTVTIPYSDEYKKFKKTETSKGHKFYEKICNASARIYTPELTKEKKEDLKSYAYVSHLDIAPEGMVSFARLATLFSTILILILTTYLFLIKGIFYSVFLLILPLVIFITLSNFPKNFFKKWQAGASDQIVLAVLYMVISMKRGYNLERAVHLAAEKLPPPLSLDFARILWQFESGTYSTVSEAMDAYLILWKDKEDEFVDAMNLIESSLLASNKKKVDNLLDKAVDVALTGVQDHMMHFAHKLQSPIKTLHMLGIVLPVLLLVMLPLVGSFLNIGIVPLILIFNIVLPIAVYAIARNVLSKRPGGISKSNKLVFQSMLAKRKSAAVTLSTLIFLLFTTPFVVLIYSAYREYPEKLSEVLLYGTPNSALLPQYVLFASVGVVIGLGMSIAFYYWYISKDALKLKRQVERIESQFSAAIFQLGSRIGEGTPTELAFNKVVEGTRGTDVSKMFELIDYNLRVKGMNLELAIFNKKSGVAWRYPSDIIKSIFKLIVEGAKKSLKAVASSLLILSRYLRDMHRVSERMKDLLADTISSMEMQASYLVAVITGIVVSLSVLIVQIMIQLALAIGKLVELEGGAGYEMTNTGVTTGLLNLFNPQNAIPPYAFQLVAGAYVVIIVILISYLLTRIVHGQDVLNRKYVTAKNLFRSMLIYGIITILGSKFLWSLAQKVVVGMDTGG